MTWFFLAWLVGLPFAGRVITYAMVGVNCVSQWRARTPEEVMNGTWRLTGLPHMFAIVWWPASLATLLIAGILILLGFRYHTHDDVNYSSTLPSPFDYPSFPQFEPDEQDNPPRLKIFNSE